MIQVSDADGDKKPRIFLFFRWEGNKVGYEHIYLLDCFIEKNSPHYDFENTQKITHQASKISKEAGDINIVDVIMKHVFKDHGGGLVKH